MELFVPGRICLYGEHSDWAGGYRSTNPSITKGRTLICGTDQGIYAKVRPHPNALVVTAAAAVGFDAEGVVGKQLPVEPLQRRAVVGEAAEVDGAELEQRQAVEDAAVRGDVQPRAAGPHRVDESELPGLLQLLVAEDAVGRAALEGDLDSPVVVGADNLEDPIAHLAELFDVDVPVPVREGR